MNEDTIIKRKEQNVRRGLKTGWKRVTLGGVTGVCVGSAAAYAASRLLAGHDSVSGDEAADATATGGARMAGGVTDDMSFADAFAAARGEVGAEGVFTWRGNVYSTCTAEEWSNMSPQRQLDYFADVSGAQPAQSQVVHHYHHTVQEQPQADTPAGHETPAGAATLADNSVGSGDEIQVVGEVEVIQNPDGTVTHVVPIEAYGHHGIVMGGENPEVAIIDINDNNQLDADDLVIDLNSGEGSTMGELYAQAAAESAAAESDPLVTVAYTEEQVAGDDSPQEATVVEVQEEPVVEALFVAEAQPDAEPDPMAMESMADQGLVAMDNPVGDMAMDVDYGAC